MAQRKTDYEAMLAADLDFAGYDFEREYRFYPKRLWRADFYIKHHNLLVEIEGISYRGQGGRHQTGAGYQADCEKYNMAVAMGYRVLRFTPAQVSGKAKRNTKGRDRMEKAIDVIDSICLAGSLHEIDKSEKGYAHETYNKW